MAKKKKKKPTLEESPTSSCLLLCDDVLISQGKGKHILHGIIGAVAVPATPAVLGGFVAYVRFSNVYPDQKIILRLEDAADGTALLEAETGFPPHADPLGVYTIIVPVPPFRVERPGRYLFTASHKGVPFATSPIEVRVVPPVETENEQD